MIWLAVGLVCLVIASFSILQFARLRRAETEPPSSLEDADVAGLRDEVMQQLDARADLVLTVQSSDAFHVERDGSRLTTASVSRLYFALADAPELRTQLIGEYVEGLLVQLHRTS